MSRCLTVVLVAALLAGCNRKGASTAPAPPAGPPAPTKPVAIGVPVTIGDVRVTLVSVSQGPVAIQAAGKGTIAGAEAGMQAKVRIENLSGDHPLSYRSWRAATPGLRWADENGNEYAAGWPAEHRPVGADAGPELGPHQTATDVIIGALPAEKATRFQLDLPAASVGQDGLFRFEFGRPEVKR